MSVSYGPNFGLSRRHVLGGLAGASMVGLPAFAQSLTPGLLKPAFLSHLSFTVSDLKASATFYQKLFGFPPLETTTPQNARTFGFYFGERLNRFLSLTPPRAGDKPGRITHYCISCDNFSPTKDGKRLTDAGFAGVRIIDTDVDQWITLPDFDKNVLQIFESKYLAKCPTCMPPPGGSSMPPPANALFKARSISHIGQTVADIKRTKDFYQKVFALPENLRSVAPASAPAYALDFNGEFVSLTPKSSNPDARDYYGIAVDNFDAQRDGKRLVDAGFKDVQVVSNEKNVAQFVTVPDPDGLVIRISDAKYIYDCATCKAPPL